MKLVIRISENTLGENTHEKNVEFLEMVKNDLMSRYDNIEIDIDFNRHCDFNQFHCDDDDIAENTRNRMNRLFEKF